MAEFNLNPTSGNILNRYSSYTYNFKLYAINKDAYNGVNLFEGTTPLSSYESSEPKAGSVDLGNPADSGVDISSLMGGASKIWQAMK